MIMTQLICIITAFLTFMSIALHLLESCSNVIDVALDMKLFPLLRLKYPRHLPCTCLKQDRAFKRMEEHLYFQIHGDLVIDGEPNRVALNLHWCMSHYSTSASNSASSHTMHHRVHFLPFKFHHFFHLYFLSSAIQKSIDVNLKCIVS